MALNLAVDTPNVPVLGLMNHYGRRKNVPIVAFLGHIINVHYTDTHSCRNLNIPSHIWDNFDGLYNDNNYSQLYWLSIATSCCHILSYFFESFELCLALLCISVLPVHIPMLYSVAMNSELWTLNCGLKWFLQILDTELSDADLAEGLTQWTIMRSFFHIDSAEKVANKTITIMIFNQQGI